jgi:hypothetical protein
MFTPDTHDAARPSRRSYSIYLPDTESSPSQMKYLMLIQLVNTCLHVISTTLQNHPGGLIPPICQIQNRLHLSWNFNVKLAENIEFSWLDEHMEWNWVRFGMAQGGGVV